MFKFDEKTELIVRNIAEFGEKTNTKVYFVGGMVRDCLMGINIKDIDILVEGSAIDFIQNFTLECGSVLCDGACKNNNSGGKLDIKIKSTHESFNTVKTIINGVEIDFASTREEKYPVSGCLPVVTKTGCTINKDLKRRDFTVNAIAARLMLSNGSINYEIIDPYLGAEDIKKKCLKILHNKSYIDDPTRILRGLDFSLRFGFDFSNKDKVLIEEYLKTPDREGLSIDRVKLTLKKLFSDPNRAKEAYLRILDDTFYKIWENEPSFKKEWTQRLYESVPIFNVPSSEIFSGAIFENQCICGPLARGVSNYEIYNFYKTLKPLEIALRYAILDDTSAIHFYKNLKDIKPDITGDDLIKQGYTQGKVLGDELKKHLMEKLNNIPKI